MSNTGPIDVEGGKAYELVEAQYTRNDKTSPDMTWVNVNFKAGSKNILSNCWGNVPAGKVCAIMGPSGAGKSSLLNVLAGRSSPAAGISIEGKVRDRQPM